MNDVTRKMLLPGAPTIGVLKLRLTSEFVICTPRFGWRAKRTQGCILVWTECPSVQSRVAHVTLHGLFAVGLTYG